MASVLPLDVKRKHKHSRFLYKSLSILVIVFLAFLYYTSSYGLSSSFHQHKLPRRSEADVTFELYHGHKLNSPPITEGGEDLDTTITFSHNDTDVTDHTSLWNNTVACTVGKIPWEYRCEYVTNHGPCGGNKYLHFQYCVMKRKLQPLYYIMILSFLLVLFYLLGDTAEEYFSPSLIKISDYLRLSPNVAGVTLLALGNGAPDLSSIIVGVLSGSTDFGVGAPIGGGTFVTTVVMGSVILLADVKVTRRPFLRDVIFYLGSVCWVLYFFIDNKVYIWESIICLIIYVIYVLVVVLGRAVNQRLKKRRLAREAARDKETADDDFQKRDKKVSKQQRQLQSNNSDMGVGLLSNSINGEEDDIQDSLEDLGARVVESDSESDSEDDDWTANRGWKRQPSFVLYDSVRLDSVPKMTDVEVGKTPRDLTDEQERQRRIKMRMEKTKSAVFIPKLGVVQRVRDEDKNQALVVREYFDPDGEVEKDDEEIQRDKEEEEEELNKGFFKKNLELFLETIEWHEKNWFQKLSFIFFEAWLMFVRNLTIPRADEENWNKWFAAAIPTCAPLLTLFAINYKYFIYMIKGVFPVAVIVLFCGLIVSGIVLITTRRSKPPVYHFLFVLLAFAMSIVWIYLVANQLLEVLESLGAAWSIKKSVLAITVLSWGNSLGDMISDITVARQGFPSMAIGATLGGPMLNLLIGIGFSMTFSPDQLKHRCFPISPDPPVAVSFMFLILSLVSSLVVIPLCRFKGYKVYGVYLILLYICNLTLSLLAAQYAPVTKAFTWNIGRSCKWTKQ